jgi:glutathione S-transferase
MQSTLKLYFSPGAVSMVTHMALEELGVPYELVPVPIKERANDGEAYRRVHPLGRLPALELEPGVVLTETPALLWYLSECAPQLELMPTGHLERARAGEWMSLFSSGVHPVFASFVRPERYTSDELAAVALKRDGLDRFYEMLRYVEQRLPAAGFLFGERYTLCDAYLTVFFLWARRVNLSVAELPRLTRIAGVVMKRPAVRRALEQEGFGQLYAA